MRIYHGWFVVCVAAIATALTTGLTASAFGLFVIPVSQDLNLSRANMNTAVVIASVGNSLAAPFVGRLVDKYPARPILVICSICYGGGLAILGISPYLWLSIVTLAVILPIGLDGTASITLNRMVARWFSRLRTRALTLAALGLSLGGMVIPPILAILLELHGWRMSLVIVGVGCIGILVGSAFLLREAPGPDDVETTRVSDDDCDPADYETGKLMTVMELLRAPQFWMVMIGAALVFATSATVMYSLVPIAVEGGLTSLAAAGLISIASVAGVLAKLALAYLGDRTDTWLLFLLTAVLSLLMSLTLMISTAYWSLLIAAILMGVAWGALLPLFLALIVALFGTASFGTARGLYAPINAATNATAIRFAGEVYDRTGSYDVMYVTFVVLSLAAIVIMFPLRRYVASPAS